MVAGESLTLRKKLEIKKKSSAPRGSPDSTWLSDWGGVIMAKMLQALIKDLKKAARPDKVRVLAGFFKTGKGEYGEGDVFWGVTVPEQRKIAKKYSAKFTMVNLEKLLASQVHECRLTALLILVEWYEQAGENPLTRLRSGETRTKIVNFYLKKVKQGRVNNWDLVDLSAPKILGDYLLDKEKGILYNLAVDKNLWVRRVAILSTLTFIKQKRFSETLKISKILISDKEDLIHKAVGWMLREVGKKEEEVLKIFLEQFAGQMPRTMLRYAIEKFRPEVRKKYLLKK